MKNRRKRKNVKDGRIKYGMKGGSRKGGLRRKGEGKVTVQKRFRKKGIVSRNKR